MSSIEIISVEQGTPEWLSLREKHIGASEAACIVGVDPWTTPYKLWQRKLGLAAPQEETEAMRRGKELEPIARKDFETQSGIFVKPVVVKNREFSFLLASMDGLSDCHTKAVEIKVPGKQSHDLAINGVIPEHYQWQLLHQMIVCDLQSIFYFSWNETSSKILEFSRDSEMEKAYLEKAKAFWESIQDPIGKPIEPGDRDYINKEEDGIWYAVTQSLKEARKRKKEAEEDEELCRKKLIQLADNQCCQGNGVRLTKYVNRGRVDYGAIEELKNVDLEKYRKPNTVAWRIS